MNKRINTLAAALVFTLSSSLFVNNKVAKATPALAIPAGVALCAGTAGVGCVVIGTVAIAGIAYTVYQAVNSEQFFAVANSNKNSTIIISVKANSEGHALEKCKKHFNKQDVKVFSITDSFGRTRWFCTDNLNFYP
jgi:uncharacterized membrane protein YebE (DUF533 family)